MGWGAEGIFKPTIYTIKRKNCSNLCFMRKLELGSKCELILPLGRNTFFLAFVASSYSKHKQAILRQKYMLPSEGVFGCRPYPTTEVWRRRTCGDENGCLSWGVFFHCKRLWRPDLNTKPNSSHPSVAA